MENNLPAYLRQSEGGQQEGRHAKRGQLSFLNKSIVNAAVTMKSIYLQAENSGRQNFFQRIHPGVKLLSLIYFEIVISFVHRPIAQMLITSFIFLLFLAAGLSLFLVYRRILFLVFIFGFLIIWPASLNMITPGKIIFNLICFSKPSQFWIYHIPQCIGFTAEGLQVVWLLFLRVLNSVSFAMLVVFTTSFPAFVKSFKIIGLPDTFLMIITLGYKYIFILSRTIEEAFFALKSRLIGNIRNNTIRKLMGGLIFNIFKKSMTNYENTWYAMVSRGYQGKIILHSPKQVDSTDLFAFIVIVAFGIGILFM
jgi:cobalt/nickel transport system permease protein